MMTIKKVNLQSLASGENPAQKKPLQGVLAGRGVCQNLKNLSPAAKIMGLAGVGLVIAGCRYAAQNTTNSTFFVESFSNHQTVNQSHLLSINSAHVQGMENPKAMPSNVNSSQVQKINLQNRQELEQKKPNDGVKVAHGLAFLKLFVFMLSLGLCYIRDNAMYAEKGRESLSF